MRFGRVEVSGGFLLLIACLNYLDYQMLVPMALTACFLHELGHIVALKLTGNTINQICLSVIGAEMELGHLMSYRQELICAGAGPLVNLLLAGVFSHVRSGTLFAGLNLSLGLFNLLPIGTMDGGRILYCLMAPLLGPDRAERIRTVIQRCLTAVLFVLGVLLLGTGGNATMLMVAIWLIILEFRRKSTN